MKSACLCTGFIRATTYVNTGPDSVADTGKEVRVRMNDIMTARMFGNVGIASSETGQSGENNDV
eukprot:COSAG02_NODE_71283_length_191_cov_97.358696_1_plen_63_part_11